MCIALFWSLSLFGKQLQTFQYSLIPTKDSDTDKDQYNK